MEVSVDYNVNPLKSKEYSYRNLTLTTFNNRVTSIHLAHSFITKHSSFIENSCLTSFIININSYLSKQEDLTEERVYAAFVIVNLMHSDFIGIPKQLSVQQGNIPNAPGYYVEVSYEVLSTNTQVDVSEVLKVCEEVFPKGDWEARLAFGYSQAIQFSTLSDPSLYFSYMFKENKLLFNHTSLALNTEYKLTSILDSRDFTKEVKQYLTQYKEEVIDVFSLAFQNREINSTPIIKPLEL